MSCLSCICPLAIACAPGMWLAANSSYLLLLADWLLKAEPFLKHRERLASDAPLQQAVADALLECCLPAVQTAVSAKASPTGIPGSGQSFYMLRRLLALLLHPNLAQALRQRLQGPAALAAVQAASQVVEALPLPRPASRAPRQFSSLYVSAIELLSAFTVHMAEQVGAQEGGSSGAPAAEAAISGSAAVAQQATISRCQQQAAWQLVAIVARLTSIIQALADGPDAATAYLGGPDAWNSRLSVACAFLDSALRPLNYLEQEAATPAQLASSAMAAAAGLRLQPLLLQLDASCQQRSLGTGARETWEGPRWLSAVLVRHTWEDLPTLQEREDATAADSKAAQRSLPFSLWEWHGTAARLCHFLASRGSTVLAGSPALSHADLWFGVLCELTSVHRHAVPALADAFG